MTIVQQYTVMKLFILFRDTTESFIVHKNIASVSLFVFLSHSETTKIQSHLNTGIFNLLFN